MLDFWGPVKANMAASVVFVESIPALNICDSAAAHSHWPVCRTDSDGAGKLQLQVEGRVGGVKLAVTGGLLQNLHVELTIVRV